MPNITGCFFTASEEDGYKMPLIACYKSSAHPERYFAVFTEHRNIKHQPSEQLLHHGGTQMPMK